jgi:chromosome segregation ATPase
MTNIYDYLTSRYGKENYQSTLHMLIVELQQKIKVLEEKYENALQDIKRLEEENIETTNQLYELQTSIESVDNRIDILYGENK